MITVLRGNQNTIISNIDLPDSYRVNTDPGKYEQIVVKDWESILALNPLPKSLRKTRSEAISLRQHSY
jgi:hypothetical protein